MAVRQITGRRLNQYAEDYVVFDLETTGISAEEDFIIEISAISKGAQAGGRIFGTGKSGDPYSHWGN